MSNPLFPSFFLPQDITRQNRLPREQMKGWHQKQLSSLDSLDRNSLISSKTQRNIWLWISFSKQHGEQKTGEGEQWKRPIDYFAACLISLYIAIYIIAEYKFLHVHYIKEMPNMIKMKQKFTKCSKDIAHIGKNTTSWQSHEYLL